MRKIRFVAMAIVMMITIVALVGCTQVDTKITSARDLEGKVVGFMAIPSPIERQKASLEKEMGVKLKELLYFDSYSAVIAALQSGKVDAAFASEHTASYYEKMNPELTAISGFTPEEKFAYCMALRREDDALLNDLNSAIATLRENGELDKLKAKYVTDLQSENQLEVKELPYFEGAPTLRVGVSGNNPPIDYIAANGSPVGYSTELLCIISEMLHVNFDIQVIPEQSRFVALTSKKIDLYFIHVLNDSFNAINETMRENENIVYTDPYCVFDSGMFLIKSK